MKYKNMKKLALILSVCSILTMAHKSNAFAAPDEPIAAANYDGNGYNRGGSSDGSGGNSGGQNSSSGSNQSSKSGSTKTKYSNKTVYEKSVPSDSDKVDWGAVKSYMDGNWQSIKSLGVKDGSGYIRDYIVMQAGSVREKTYSYSHPEYDRWGNPTGDTIVTNETVTTVVPNIIVNMYYIGNTKNILKNYQTPYYNWKKVSGPAGGTDQEAWRTPTSNSLVKYYKVGDYTISSVPHLTWDIYERDTFKAVAESFHSSRPGVVTLSSKNYDYDTKVGSGEADDMSRYKTYTMKIAAQDLNQNVEVKSTVVTPNADAEPVLVQ